MSIRKIAVVCLGVCLLFVASAGFAATQKYIVGIDGDYPPYSFVGADGKPTGFDVESVQWIAGEMGFEVEIRPTAWDGIIPALLAKKIDMVYSGMTANEERRKVVDFSDIYWEIDQAVAVKQDSAVTMDDFLAGKATVGTQRGCTAADWIEDELVKKNILASDKFRLYDSFPAAAMDLEIGRVEAAMMDDMIVLGAIKGKPLKIIGTIKTGEEYAVAIRKEDKELKDKINEGIRRLMASPKWEELKAKYDMQK
ncbi:MAG: transporter substrate-binding domain-containing protein [Synergistaceae bacterium]|jgi:polar amino acid transport system substrate-binding protein|nr:transporter substrate-binding domain-containing protein [Synergistaceae bacterium]